MQSPEVYNFAAPETLFNVEKFQGSIPSNNPNINSFHYNHLVTVIIPDPQNFSGNFESLLEKNIFYKISDLNLEEFADIKFISSFIRNGKLTLLSSNERVDCDNCIGITPDCKLFLNLDRETYQSLGLEGVSSHFTKKLENRYIVSVDLSDDNLLKNKSKLQKLKSCLQVLKPLTVLLSWEPPDAEVCPSSIAKYFVDLGYAVKQCTTTFHSHVVSSQIPNVQFGTCNKSDTLELIEWLGMVALECNLGTDATNYLSSYVPPDGSEEFRRVMCLRLQGFFSSQNTMDVIQKITKTLQPLSNKWAAIYVQGFSDCPVAWGNEEHHYYTNGDNGYILIWNDDCGWICTHRCSRKRYK